MTEMEFFIITLLITISALLLHRLLRITDATQRRKMITDDIAGCCESLGFIGCSVICCGIREMEHIEELLGQEYDRYEVIITLDAEQYPNEFRTIISHYRMIRVNCSLNEELPSASIRTLYRSRQRSFRRLILIDRAESDTYDDLDAATLIASYNYLLPIGHNTHLCDKAIESIVIALSEQSIYNVEMLCSTTTESYVFRRDVVIANGGFSPHLLRQIPRSSRLKIDTPLTFRPKQQFSTLPTIAIMAAILATTYSIAGYLITAATAMTMIFTAVSTRYISHLIHPANCSLQVMLCYFRQIVSIFKRRKFLVS